MGNCKMLCQTPINGCHPSLAPVRWLPWLQKKGEVEEKVNAELLRAQREHNGAHGPVLAVRGTLLTVCPMCQSRTVHCVARSLGPLNSLLQRFFPGDSSQGGAAAPWAPLL